MVPGRVVVVHPPVTVARDFIDYPYHTDLGAVQLAAVLEGQGAVVGLVDAFALPASTLAWRPDGRAHLGASVGAVLDAVAAGGEPSAVVVAYTPFHRPPHRDDVLAAVLDGLRARFSGARLLLADCYQSGQHYVEVSGEAVLGSYPTIDAWVKYEAEETVPALLGAEVIERRAYAGAEPSLDRMPAPAWHRVDLRARDAFLVRFVARLGRGGWAFPTDGRTLPLVTSRGCPFRCVHCSSNPGRQAGAPKTQRRIPLARLEAQVRTLVREHGATRLMVLDELLNVSERHFDGFLDLVTELEVPFEVPNGMRADYLLPRHLERMRGRVTTVSVSAESGVQRVVDEVVDKRLDLAHIERAAEAAHDAGVPLMIHFMIGLPGESLEEIDATLERALDLCHRFGAAPAVQYAIPLPGTRLGEGRRLPVVEDWGPYFQRRAVPLGAVDADTLRRMMTRFEQRLAKLLPDRAPPPSA